MTKTNVTVYWTVLKHEWWSIHIAATSQGICYIGSQNKPFEEMKAWVEKRYPYSILVQADQALQPYVSELIDYFLGKRQTFSMPFDLLGTSFQMSVWKALCSIPYGQTKSYSDIANHIHRPSAVRAVGAAIGANPVLITVPCHRVIGKNGALTGFRGGLEMKMKLLQLEQDHCADNR